MALKANFTQEGIKAYLDNFLKDIENKQIRAMQYLGEMCVKHARENGDYTDQTGNLRSSIGYIVFVNGVAVHEGYEVVKSGSEGADEGSNLARSIGAKYSEGVCLVVTAGMNYAVAVESRGKDVLTSAEILAKQELPRMLESLKNKQPK